MLGGRGGQPQERGDFFLDVEDGFGRGQLLTEALVLPPQPCQFLLPGRADRAPPPPGSEGGELALIPLLAPMGQMGGIEAFPPPQRREVPGLTDLRLPENAHLIGGGELPTPRALRYLGVRWG